MYLQCPLKNSRTAIIIFYAVCLLYVLSTATFVSDLVAFILDVSANNSICKNTIFFISFVQTRFTTLSPRLRIDSLPMLFHISIIQTTANGCCDFLAQCILVRINHCTCHPFYSLKCSLAIDLPLLDRLGSRHPCCDHSFIFGNRILRSV